MKRYLIIVYHGMHHDPKKWRVVEKGKYKGVDECVLRWRKNMGYKCIFLHGESLFSERVTRNLNKLLLALNSPPEEIVIAAHRGCIDPSDVLEEYNPRVILFSGDLGFWVYSRYINPYFGGWHLSTPFTWEELVERLKKGGEDEDDPWAP